MREGALLEDSSVLMRVRLLLSQKLSDLRLVGKRSTHRERASNALIPLKTNASANSPMMMYQSVRANIRLCGLNIPPEPMSIPMPDISSMPGRMTNFGYVLGHSWTVDAEIRNSQLLLRDCDGR